MICYSKVKFLGKNGRDNELSEAKRFFKVGKSYFVREVRIHNWHTEVLFMGVAGAFNSVMFDGIKGSEV